jgi:hypothetical protein
MMLKWPNFVVNKLINKIFLCMTETNTFIIVFLYILVLPKNRSEKKQSQGWRVAAFLFKLTEQKVIMNSASWSFRP